MVKNQPVLNRRTQILVKIVEIIRPSLKSMGQFKGA